MAADTPWKWVLYNRSLLHYSSLVNNVPVYIVTFLRLTSLLCYSLNDVSLALNILPTSFMKNHGTPSNTAPLIYSSPQTQYMLKSNLSNISPSPTQQQSVHTESRINYLPTDVCLHIPLHIGM